VSIDQTEKVLCACGCGEPTEIAPKTDSRWGWVKGEPRRVVTGHAPRLRTRPAGERFWAKVDKSGDCWLWLGWLDVNGYGHFHGEGGVKRLAHRWAYQEQVGPIPDGLVLDHLCRNRACVRPDHLEPVTSFENRSRGLRSPLATRCIHGHEYSPENTYVYKGRRTCRTCQRGREVAYRAKKKES
jgi:hypothetical protein